MSLENLVPETVSAPLSPIAWMELAASKVTPAISNVIDKWPEESANIECFECSAFWQIPEIFELSQFHQNSLALLQGE